jgi:hypothetical protein
MVLEVLPAPHGKAIPFVTDAMSVHVQEVNRDGGHVIRVCWNCDSTYVQTLGEHYCLLADAGAHNMRSPLHRPEMFRRQTNPGTDAGYCSDIDHQGKSMRYLSVDGQWLTVFPRFLVAVYSLDVNAQVLRDLPAPCLWRDVAGKMDDLQAVKPYSGPSLIQIGEHLRFANGVVDKFPVRSRDIP